MCILVVFSKDLYMTEGSGRSNANAAANMTSNKCFTIREGIKEKEKMYKDEIVLIRPSTEPEKPGARFWSETDRSTRLSVVH